MIASGEVGLPGAVRSARSRQHLGPRAPGQPFKSIPMATPTETEQTPIAGQVLLYKTPEPLDPVRHANLGMIASDRPYGFAHKQHFVPVQVAEFAQVAINYPIVFAGDDYAPIAIMGLQGGENLYIAEDGAFRVGAYAPSFIRRYPFVGARDDAAQRMVICIDRSFALWTETNPTVKLFENGQPTDFTKSCIEFCQQFDQDRAVTEAFCKLLRELDILETKQTSFTPRLPDGSAGEPVLIAEYFAVSEEKLKTLSPEKVADLAFNGALSAIYAHLMSLNCWDRIILESAARQTPGATALNVKL